MKSELSDIEKLGIKMFEGSEVPTSRNLASYIKKYPGKLPASETSKFKNLTETKESFNADAWDRVSMIILRRDFHEEPIDDSTKASWMMGLKGCNSENAKMATAKLNGTKTVKWGQKDVKAGRLLPRKKKDDDNEPNTTED